MTEPKQPPPTPGFLPPASPAAPADDATQPVATPAWAPAPTFAPPGATPTFAAPTSTTPTFAPPESWSPPAARPAATGWGAPPAAPVAAQPRPHRARRRPRPAPDRGHRHGRAGVRRHLPRDQRDRGGAKANTAAVTTPTQAPAASAGNGTGQAAPSAQAPSGQQAPTSQPATGQGGSLVDVVKAVSPAVVTITAEGVTATDPTTGQTGQGTAMGSGVIFDANGLILTNHHVVEGNPSKLTVTLKDGRTFDASIYGIDTLTDLAIVKVDQTGLPTAPIGDSSAIQVGQQAIAIGSPLGQFTDSVTSGIISALGRSIDVEGGHLTT